MEVLARISPGSLGGVVPSRICWCIDLCVTYSLYSDMPSSYITVVRVVRISIANDTFRTAAAGKPLKRFTQNLASVVVSVTPLTAQMVCQSIQGVTTTKG